MCTMALERRVGRVRELIGKLAEDHHLTVERRVYETVAEEKCSGEKDTVFVSHDVYSYHGYVTPIIYY